MTGTGRGRTASRYRCASHPTQQGLEVANQVRETGSLFCQPIFSPEPAAMEARRRQIAPTLDGCRYRHPIRPSGRTPQPVGVTLGASRPQHSNNYSATDAAPVITATGKAS